MSKLVTTSSEGLLLGEPFHAFWTAYDPLDLASGSLDALGFARGYLALADRFLPSFTTVTDIPRYVSMLCATLRKVQIHYDNNSRIVSSKDRQERLKKAFVERVRHDPIFDVCSFCFLPNGNHSAGC